LPKDSIKIEGSGKTRTLKITPTKKKSGESFVTIKVTDGKDTASTQFKVTVTKATSVQSEEANTITVSPNPASDYIEINFGNIATSEAKEIKIYNPFGECVMTVGAIHELPQQRIDISHLPAGMYFVRLGNLTEKFVVIR
ncbi:MAG: T9SS type A sorting domain-containing protein, partial [Ignavibacteria bacterium]|nr:T9SS type A sorting domain-containing protein [Ignavibacteria bacterium]